MSSNPIDEHLARLAPDGSPDPERFTAARADLFAALDTAGAGSDTRPTGPDPDDEPDGLSAHLAQVRVEVVVPADPHRRRRRRAAWSLAAAALVAVAGAAVFFRPADHVPAPASGAEIEACRDLLTEQRPGMPEPPLGSDARLVASGELDGTAFTLFAPAKAAAGDGAAGDPALCHVPDGDLSRTNFVRAGDGGPAPSADDVTELGTAATEPLALSERDSGAAAWGRAGESVDSVTVTTTQGQEVDAVVAGGFWVAWWLRDDPTDDVADITWTVSDGSESSRSVSGAWPGVAETNSLAEERRGACTNPELVVLEDQRDDHGLTVFANDNRLGACVQAAEAPYETSVTMNGTVIDPAPSADGAAAVSAGAGGADGPVGVVVGVAGDDVSEVTVERADGTTLRTGVVGGYWAVWSELPYELSEELDGPWDGATLRWTLRDGSSGGSGPLFP